MRRFASILLLSSLAACNITIEETPSGSVGAPRSGELPRGDQGGVRKIGKPYQIAGVWYYPKEDPNYDETGKASWYGPNFHGKKTANGEIYNMNALTAAHRTLPMPTYVKVTNLENGRTLVLRVNDRGPFAKGRIIDISRRGAQLLGFERQGTTRVRVQASDANGRVRGGGKAAPSAPSRLPDNVANAADAFFIQVGAYIDRKNAQIQVNKLRSEGFSAQLIPAETINGTFWRVRVGPYKNRNDAERTLDRVVSDGFYEARIFTEAS